MFSYLGDYTSQCDSPISDLPQGAKFVAYVFGSCNGW